MRNNRHYEKREALHDYASQVVTADSDGFCVQDTTASVNKAVRNHIRRVEHLFSRYIQCTSTSEEEIELVELVRKSPQSIPESIVETLIPELVTLNY